MFRLLQALGVAFLVNRKDKTARLAIVGRAVLYFLEVTHMDVELHNIGKSFDKRVLFTGLSNQFSSETVNVIIGESGSGKTTLLNIMSLFEKPDFGDVLFDGRKVSGLSNKETRKIIRSSIGYIYQDIRLFEDLTVEENINLALRFSDIPQRECCGKVVDILERLGLPGRQKQIAQELSGGEKQRVAIARSLVCGKKLLFADEPTGALDEGNTRNVIELLKDVKREFKCTVFLVTHSAFVAGEFDNIFSLHNGSLERSSE